MRIICVSVCAFCVFAFPALSDSSTTSKIDLGTLTWTYKTGGLFEATITDKKAGITNCYLDNSIYSLGSDSNNLSNNQYSGDSSSQSIYVKNATYTDVASFKTAMTGVYLYYQPNTDTTATWTAPSLIKVATTKYVEEKFAGSVTDLNAAIDTVKTVVDNTIIQADRIGKLYTGKQTRPSDSCPNNAQCLLITEADGSLHWYPICNADGAIFDPSAFLTSLTAAGKPAFKLTQDSDGKWTYCNAFFMGLSAWRQQYVDGNADVFVRPFAHATRCTSPNYSTSSVGSASPCYTETGMYKTLTDGEWAIVYEGDEKASNASTPVDPGLIYGISKCVSTNLTGSVSTGTKATAAQLADPLFNAMPANTTDAKNYKQCWCKMTAIGLPGDGSTVTDKAANGGIASISGSAWFFAITESLAANCAYACPYECAYQFVFNASFRSAILSTNN